MKNLLAFLQKYFHWVLFVTLEVVSLVLLFQYNHYQNSVWSSSANVVVGKIYEWSSALDSYFSLKKVNENLTLRNFYLERQVSQLRRLYQESQETQSKEERKALADVSQYSLVPAKVISNATNTPDNLMTIDKGSKDGIEEGMGVVCGAGIVGITYLTSTHYTVVIPVLNSRSSRISCAIRGHGYFGVLRWYGGDSRYAFVEGIPRHARFKRGDWVETNGYSSIFPEGVLVGKIVEVYNSRDGLSYKLKVQLSTNFGTLRDAVVVTHKAFAERARLIQAANDSLKLNVRE